MPAFCICQFIMWIHSPTAICLLLSFPTILGMSALTHQEHLSQDYDLCLSEVESWWEEALQELNKAHGDGRRPAVIESMCRRYESMVAHHETSGRRLIQLAALDFLRDLGRDFRRGLGNLDSSPRQERRRAVLAAPPPAQTATPGSRRGDLLASALAHHEERAQTDRPRDPDAAANKRVREEDQPRPERDHAIAVAATPVPPHMGPVWEVEEAPPYCGFDPNNQSQMEYFAAANKLTNDPRFVARRCVANHMRSVYGTQKRLIVPPAVVNYVIGRPRPLNPRILSVITSTFERWGKGLTDAFILAVEGGTPEPDGGRILEHGVIWYETVEKLVQDMIRVEVAIWKAASHRSFRDEEYDARMETLDRYWIQGEADKPLGPKKGPHQSRHGQPGKGTEHPFHRQRPCLRCGDLDHSRDQCPIAASTPCASCGRMNHTAKVCRHPKKGTT